MKRDAFTLPLFAGDLLPSSPQLIEPTMPAHWPPAERENFAWWCRNGNQELCSAVLWQSEGFTKANADDLVKHLHGQPEPLLMTETPACAHYACPIPTTSEHAA